MNAIGVRVNPVVLLISAMLAVGSLTVPAAAAAAPPGAPQDIPSPKPVAADEPSARVQAQRSGKQVEVLSAKSETARVFANPNGTLTAQISAVPQRVRRADNSWTDINTSLRVVGAMLKPVVSAANVQFSGGGSGPLVRFAAGGGMISYSWDGVLPTPAIEGDTAVYANVYPDVDLRVRALADGFTYALVVKTRAAAKNPALHKLKLKVTGDRLSLVAKPGGGFVAKNTKGQPTVETGAGVMWDSRGASTVEIPQSSREQALMGLESTAAEQLLKAKDLLAEPADSARTSNLPTTFRDGALTVDTDLSLLTNPDAVFPLVIDPVSRTIPGSGAPHWGFASSDNENRTDGIARVGPDPEEYSSVWRSFFGFPVTSTIGGPATITQAGFQTWLIHSGACASTPVNLYGVGTFSAGRSNWPGASLDVNLGQRSGHANKSACPQPDMYMEWKDDNVKNYVQSKLTAGASLHNFGLAIANVNGDNLWKKYDPNRTSLWVEWNKKPTTPVATDLATASEATSSDIACTGTPWVRGKTPALRAALRDPDNEEGGQLTGNFNWQRWDGNAWQASGSATKTTAPATPSAPGNRAEVVLPQLVQDTRYRWQLTVTDTGSLTSDPGPWCEFIVASEAPAQKPTVSSTDYPTSGVNGVVGQSGRFNFGPNGVSNVASYTYWLEGGPARTVTPATQGGSVSDVPVTPTNIGQNTLHVMSRDPAGNSSEEILYKFSVDNPAGPVSKLEMNGALTDIGSAPKAFTVAGGPIWTNGRYAGASAPDRAIVLDGVNDVASTSSWIVDHTKAFTMGAWVKLPALPSANGVLLSSGTAAEGVFELRYLTTGGWCFAGIYLNGGTRQGVDACSGTNIRLNEWTHILGVYDPSSARQLSIYVNGALAGHQIFTAATEAPAEFHIGAAKRGGGLTAFFPGVVSDVRVWRQAITPQQKQIADDFLPKQIGGWDLNDRQLDESGTVNTAVDLSGHANTLSFSVDPLDSESAATWSEGPDYTGAVMFGQGGQTGGFGNSPSTVVSTDSSFTVAGYVFINERTQSRQVLLSQDGNNTSGFALYYEAGSWTMEMADSDSATASVSTASMTDGGVDDWHHVAAVFDSATRTLRVYVDGAPGAAVQMNMSFTPWQASGSLIVGRGFGTSGWLNATVDSLRVYATALTGPQVGQVRDGFEPTPGVDAAPGIPTNTTIDGSAGTGMVIWDDTPNFVAALSDADSGALWFQVALTSGAAMMETTAMTKVVPGTQTLAWPTNTSPDWPAKLTLGVTYSYKVRAYDGVLFGQWSAPKSFSVYRDHVVNHPPVATTTAQTGSIKIRLEPGGYDYSLVAGYRYGTDPKNLNATALTTVDGIAELLIAPAVPTTLYFQALMADGTANLNLADGKPNTTVLANLVVSGAVAKRGDVEGDGRADSVGLMDVGGGYSMPYVVSGLSEFGGATPQTPMGSLTYVNAVTEHGVGDFDGDKHADIAVLTEVGGALKLKVLKYNGFAFTEVDTGYVPQSGMNADKTKLLVGDVNGDGKDDVTIVYEHGASWWKTWVSLANGSGTLFGPAAMWYENPSGWSDYRRSQWFMGDFNGDGKAEVGHFYNYDNCQTKFWGHKSTGTSFVAGSMKWDGGTNNWCWDRGIPVAGDFDGNGTADIATTYRYDGCWTKVWLWKNTADAAQTNGFYSTGSGTAFDPGAANMWCGDKTEPTTGDFTGDGRTDVRLNYHCCGTRQHQIWTLKATGNMAFASPALAWQGGIGPIGTGNFSTNESTLYKMVPKHSGQCLGVPEGSIANTIQLIEQQCAYNEPHKLFRLVHDGAADRYRIKVEHTGKCLNVRYGASANGTQVDQYDCASPQVTNELWQVRYASGSQDAVVEIVSLASGKCLDVDPTPDTLTIYACHGGNNQRFSFYKVSSVSPQSPLGWWKMNETGGTTLADSSGNNRTATIVQGATVANGYATFNGTNGWAETTASVLNTGKSFSVSSWVRLTPANANKTAVSQDGNIVPGFELGVKPNGSGAEWQVERAASDTQPPSSWAVAAAGSLAPTGTWAHLIAVYDAPAGQLRLYVNKTLVSTVACNYSWNAAGKLRIGKAQGGDYWPGDIDDVRVWNKVLSPAEINALYTGGRA